MFPEKQQKAQEEIDRVIGSEKFPSFEDRSSLPYVEALICECLRWHPTSPTGEPVCFILASTELRRGEVWPTIRPKMTSWKATTSQKVSPVQPL